MGSWAWLPDTGDGSRVHWRPKNYWTPGTRVEVTAGLFGGVHVIMSTEPEKTMSTPTFGYTDVHVVRATRISNNGEYVHADPETLNAQGQENVTHGCVNMAVPNAKIYDDAAMIGDPVEVTGRPIGLSAADGDVYDRTIGWDTWSGMSALRAAS